MAASLVDSILFRDLFGTDEMQGIFSDERLVAHYLRIEAALAKVQGTLGVIPASAAAVIQDGIARMSVNYEELRRDTTLVGYPIVGLVGQIARECREGAGEYVHWGATTQDIMDTAVVLQIREALEVIGRDLAALNERLSALAARHRDALMAGRTHLQHALPIMFGYKCAVWLSGIRRHRQRLCEVAPRVLVGQFGGATGTLASLGEKAGAVQGALMRELNLGCPDITWHVARDSLAETVSLLGLVTGTLGKIAYDVMLLMMNEVGELLEPHTAGRGSSSTMPQKHNPICCELILSCGRIVRQDAALMLDAMVQDLERATGPWHVEWHALPESFIFAGAALHHARFLLDGLRVNESRMRANLELTGGLILAEAVMMALAERLGRQNAYKLVYDACRTAPESDRTLRDVLMADGRITSALGPHRLDDLLQARNYVGLAPAMVDRLVDGAAAFPNSPARGADRVMFF